MFRRLFLFLFLAVALILTGCNAKPVEKSSLKIGSMPRVFDLIAYVGLEEGLFQKEGVDVELVPFRSTIEMNTALITGELDGMIQDIFEVVNLNKEDKTSKVVGWAAMPRMFEVVVSKDSGIDDVAGLKGEQIALANSSIMEYALDRLLLANGVDSKDITKVNIPVLPLRLEALNQGKVPAAILTPPLSDLAVVSEGKVVLDDTDEPFAGPGLIFSNEALKTKSNAISKFVVAWQQSVDMINQNPEKYQALLNEVASVPEAVDFEIPEFPKLHLSIETQFNSIVDWFMDKGLLNERLNYQDVVETKYLK